jgi:hypothetical protein
VSNDDVRIIDMNDEEDLSINTKTSPDIMGVHQTNKTFETNAFFEINTTFERNQLGRI